MKKLLKKLGLIQKRYICKDEYYPHFVLEKSSYLNKKSDISIFGIVFCKIVEFLVDKKQDYLGDKW